MGVVLMALGVVLASCDDSNPPTGPQPPGGPPSPPTPTVVRIEVSAPGQVAPGESVQLSAQAVKSDGSREDISSRAQWSSSVPGILDVSPSGLAGGRQPGESLVSARLDGRTATVRVFVLPTGTFRLSGETHEFGRALPEVSIEVLDGTGAGLKTVSDQNGRYVLYGVSGAIRLQVKKDGFFNRVEQMSVTSHATRNLGLEADSGYDTYNGTYTLTVTAVPSCSGAFPDAARRRVYTAHVLQSRTSLVVQLGDADFILTQGYGNGFGGYSSLGKVFFDLRKGDFYYYYFVPEYQLVERLSPTSAIVVYGFGEGAGPASHLRGRLGTIAVTSRLTAPHHPFVAWCNADFELVRR